MKKILAIVIAGLLGMPLFALAVNVTVPSAPSDYYFLVSTSTGQYLASSTPFFKFGFSFSLATGTQATTTNFFSTTASTSRLFIGTGSGLLKSVAGLVSVATAGTDYQAPITLTTTGSSGVATFIANTLNIPNYGAGTFASTTLLGDNNTFSGNNTFSNLITGSVSGNAGTATRLATGRTLAITGDLAWTSPSFDGSGNVTAAGTLATVNGNVGTFGSATQVPVLTVNGKGLITGVTNTTITPAASSITGGAALTKTDDTNVTLTLGGSPTAALLAATSLTLGWTGTLADSRVADNLTISGGTIDNSPIGNSTPSTGIFTNATSSNLSVSNNASTTNLYINQAVGCLQVNAVGKVVSTGVNCSTGGSGDPYPFQGAGNSTSTLVQFNAGLTAYNASSTITNLTVTTSTTTNAILQGVTGLNTVENIITTGTGNTGEIRFTPAGVASTGFVFKRYGSAIGSGLNNTGELWNFESTGNSGIRFGGSGGEAMRVDTINARVGIGTVSPQTALDVQGTASATNATTTTFFGAGLTNCNSASNALTWTTTGKFGCNSITGGSGDPYPFKGTGNSTSTLTQFNAGLTAYATSTIGDGSVSGGLTISGNSTTTGIAKIGLGNGTIIGTNGQLVVNQNGAAGLIVHNSTAGNEYGAFAGANGHASAGATTNNQFRLLANNTPQVYIDPGNFVGIGTSTPVWQLQLATSTRPQLALSDGIITDNHWTLRSIGNNLYFATASPATFATSSVSALSIDTNGFLTIPANKGVGCSQFDANGKITNTGLACGSGSGGTNTDKFATSSTANAIYPNAADKLFVGLTSGGTAKVEIQGSSTSATEQSLLIWNSLGATGPILSALNNRTVGVATSTPTSPLTVATTTLVNAAFPIGLSVGPNGLTSGSANGTLIGGNTQAGFTGNLLDFQVNGTDELAVSSAGTLTANGNLIAAAGGNLQLNGRSIITSASDGVTELSNNANTGFTRLQLGGTTASFPALGTSGQKLFGLLADGTNGGFFGFGTSTPQWTFESSSSTAPQLVLDNTAAAANGQHLAFNWTGNELRIGTTSDSTFTSTSTALRLVTNALPGLAVGSTTVQSAITAGTASGFPAGTAGASTTQLFYAGFVGSSSPSFAIESANNNGKVLVATTTNAANTNAVLAIGGKIFLSSQLTITGTVGDVCLNATGEVQVNPGAANCTVSARRYKTDILDSTLGLDALNKIDPVTFTYKSDGTKKIGFIADDLATIDNRLGVFLPDGQIQSFDEAGVLSITVKAVQELEAKGVKAARSAEENWQWFAIGILATWNVYLTFRKK